MPTQPKGCLYFRDSDSVYVSSKEIPGFTHINRESKTVLERFSPENYGTSKGFKGLGELFFFVSFVLSDSDFCEHNLGYAGQQLYKIDEGRAFEGPDFSQFITNQLNDLNQHPIFTRELFGAYLKFIVLPDSLFDAFTERTKYRTRKNAIIGSSNKR